MCPGREKKGKRRDVLIILLCGIEIEGPSDKKKTLFSFVFEAHDFSQTLSRGILKRGDAPKYGGWETSVSRAKTLMCRTCLKRDTHPFFGNKCESFSSFFYRAFHSKKGKVVCLCSETFITDLCIGSVRCWSRLHARLISD